MNRYTRTGVSQSGYQKALQSADRPWAQKVIAQYEAQRAVNQKLGKYQRENLRDWTPAERAFAGILKESGIRFIREQGFNCRNGRNYFVDFFVKNGRIGFEIDGGIHKRQENYDTARDIAIMSDYKMPIIRFTNEEVLNERGRVKTFTLQAIQDRRDEAIQKRQELAERKAANRAREHRTQQRREAKRLRTQGVPRQSVPCHLSTQLFVTFLGLCFYTK